MTLINLNNHEYIYLYKITRLCLTTCASKTVFFLHKPASSRCAIIYHSMSFNNKILSQTKLFLVLGITDPNVLWKSSYYIQLKYKTHLNLIFITVNIPDMTNSI